MATRRTKHRNSPHPTVNQAVIATIGLGSLALAVNNPAAFVAIVFTVAGGLVAVWFIKRSHRSTAQNRFLESLAASIEQHENALISYYHQSRREDQFGNRDESRWHGWIDTFLRKQVVPDIADYPAWRQSPIGQQAVVMVHDATARKVAIHKATNPLARVDAADLTPLEYEQHCAELLKVKGWTIRMTTATRDGGADFIAEKHDWRMVVQCKRYAQPVGNKAVQEVTSAVRLYNGNIACVVAPTGFTRQAQQEANGLSVHLLHHSGLPAFAEKLAV